MRILIVEDDLTLATTLKISLERASYTVDVAGTLEGGRQAIKDLNPDLILLDLQLPDGMGTDLLNDPEIKMGAPVIVLTALDDENTQVHALDIGAIDYVSKPYRESELLARIRSAMRRRLAPSAALILEWGELVMSLSDRKVSKAGKAVALTQHEYALLKALMSASGGVVTHRQLIRAAWSERQEEFRHYLRIYISSLRKKIEDDPLKPKLIVNDLGVGYRMGEVKE